jgi:hyperosmotically inducible periplasmic protein
MRGITLGLAVTLLALGVVSCSRTNSVAYKDAVEKALEQAELKDVTVAEDKDKNTITLGGKLHSDDAKQKAGQIAEAAAPGRIVANEISIEPVGVADDARKIESNVDDGIESNYKAILIANGLSKQNIRFSSKNGVLTLKGKVKAAQQKQEAPQLASSIPNVAQVVNQIEVSR